MEMKFIYPFDYKGEKLIEKDLCVIRTNIGHLCGYVAFKSDKVPEDWHGNYDAPGLQHLAIHGGMTYASIDKDKKWAIFGFDCAHLDDNKNPNLSNLKYVMKLAKQMKSQMVKFIKAYSYYKDCEDKEKAEILDTIIAKAGIKTEMGFGSKLNLLSGKLDR